MPWEKAGICWNDNVSVFGQILCEDIYICNSPTTTNSALSELKVNIDKYWE